MPSIKWITLLVIAITIGFGVLWIVLDSINTLSSPDNKKPIPITNLENKTIINNFTTYIDTQYVEEYSLPKDTWPNAILVDENGIIWTAGSKSHLYSFNPKQYQIKSSYPITEDKTSQDNDSVKSSFMFWSMIKDNDGFIWLSQFGPRPLWRFDPNTEKFHLFSSVSAAPYQMKVDKEAGNIWFTTLTGNTLGVIQKIDEKDSESAYKITEFNLGTDTYPAGLFLENDHVWVTQMKNNKLVRFDVAKESGVVNITNKFEIPSGEKRLYLPTDVLVLDDNSVWFTEHGRSTFTRYNVDSQTLTRFPTSASPYQTTTLPFWVGQSADGKGFWFNEHTGNRIAFFNTADMVLTEYEIPTRPSDGYIVYPLGIAVDSKDSNKLWFSEWNTDRIAVVDRSIPIPFDIHSDVTKVVLSNHIDTAKIHIKVTKNDNIGIPSYNEIVSLKVSSSMEPAAGLVNITAIFSADTIDLTEITEETTLQLTLQNHYAPPGNYILAISASDGSVTKSIFLNLVIE